MKKSLEDLLEYEERDNSQLYPNDDLDIDSDTLDDQIKKLKSDRYSSDTQDRKWLAKWTAGVVSLWLLLVIFSVMLNELFCFNISDSVLIALLGTTTLNVLGLSFIVLRGHFNSTNK